tara:strand:+ start:112 stop:468 length:357 start_codon:yes stop_codon:yes gene_type:complete
LVKNKHDLVVLVVDGVVQARDLTRALLAYMGVDWVFTVGVGHEARKFLNRSGAMIDLIVCDWRIPRMSGPELLIEVRNDYSDMESIKTAARHNKTAYIRKPFSPWQFKDKLITVLDKL